MAVPLKKYFQDFIVIENFIFNRQKMQSSIFQKEIMHFNFDNEKCINKIYQKMNCINKIQRFFIKQNNKYFRKGTVPSSAMQNKISHSHKKIIKLCREIKEFKIEDETKVFNLPTDRLEFYAFINKYPHLTYELIANKVKITSSISKESIFHISLMKVNLNTADGIKILRSYFNTDIGFSGNKDRRAITIQRISLKSTLEKLIEYFLLFEERSIQYKEGIPTANILIGQIFVDRRHLKLGDHHSNRFKIIIRENLPVKNISLFKNYFGEQRFGKNKNNHVVGELIFKRKNSEARELLRENGIDHISRKDRVFFIHAYQSYIFNNQVLQEDFENLYCINEKKKILEKEDGHSEKCYALQLHNTDGKKKYLRKIYAEPFNFLHKKYKSGHKLSFTLEPSVYATVFIDNIFSTIDSE